MKSTYAHDAMETLSAVSYFARLDPANRQLVVQSAIRREYDPGQLVILEGEPATGLYVVQDGWLKVVKIAIDGREQVIQFLGPGEAFSAISIFTGTPNPASVTALEKAVLWVVPRDVMLRLLDDHPGLARLVIQDLAARVLHLIGLVEDLSLRTVEARLARLLLEQSAPLAQSALEVQAAPSALAAPKEQAAPGEQAAAPKKLAGQETINRRRWATQSEMAARLGTVPDVVNRILRKLSEEGLIQVTRRQIQILDRPALEAKAEIEL